MHRLFTFEARPNRTRDRRSGGRDLGSEVAVEGSGTGLSSGGLLAGVGLLLAVEPIVDMGRTALNVTGQALVPTIVAKQEGILDEDAYNAPRKDVYADESAEPAPVAA